MGRLTTSVHTLELGDERVASVEHGPGSAWTILLYSVRVEPNHRGKGLGTLVLTSFIESADVLDLEIKLWIEPDDDCPLTPDQLRNWYSRHGFLNAGYHEMIRPRRSTWN